MEKSPSSCSGHASTASRILLRTLWNFLPKLPRLSSLPHLSPDPKIKFDLAALTQALFPPLQKKKKNPPSLTVPALNYLVNSQAGETTNPEIRGGRHRSQGKETDSASAIPTGHQRERASQLQSRISFCCAQSSLWGSRTKRRERKPPFVWV